MTIDMADIINPLTTLVAAFAGSWSAFKWHEWHERKKIVENNIHAANKALYTLSNMWGVLYNYKIAIIDPYREKEDAWLNLPAGYNEYNGAAGFNLDDLAFLLGTEHANAVRNLLIEEQRFSQIMQNIRMRSNLVINHVFEKLSRARISVGQPQTEEEMEEVLGTGVVVQLRHITKAIIKDVDKSLTTVMAVHDELRDTMKAIYPGRKFIQIQLKDENQRKASGGK